MDLADDCLAELDIVIASIHSGFNQDAAQMTDRLLRAIACPWVDVARPPDRPADPEARAAQGRYDAVIDAAAAAGVAHGDQRQVDRLDLDDLHARRARDAGARLVISSDAHSTGGFGALRWGVTVARRAWLTPATC